MDAPTVALAACLGCGCAGGACLQAPEGSLPAPIETVRAAIVDVIDGNGGDRGYDNGYRYNR